MTCSISIVETGAAKRLHGNEWLSVEASLSWTRKDIWNIYGAQDSECPSLGGRLALQAWPWGIPEEKSPQTAQAPARDFEVGV